MMSKRILAALLLAAMTFGTLSCGGTSDPQDSDTQPSSGDDSTSAGAEEGYVYPELDMGGDTFTILNATTTWGFYSTLDLETSTGDKLDDAVYDRNRDLEERYKFKMEIADEDINEGYTKYQNAILANEEAYDVGFVPAFRLGSFISDEALYNLLDYPEFQLEQDYWDHSVTDTALIGSGDKLYFASTDFSLFGFDGTLCVYFNENKLNDLQLDTPYDMVRDGSWTLDKISEYMKAGANLNGDSSFSWDKTANATYGMVSWAAAAGSFIIGSGESYIVKDEDNIPTLGIENNRFYDVADKVAGIFSKEGEFLAQNGANEDHYETIFQNGRALFLTAEIKAMSKYRNMDDNFGIVPIPKYEESQDGYHSFRTSYALMMTVPVTNTKPAETGIIMDALTYMTAEDVLPVYYEVNLSQKGLRNEDSIEMLDIIRDSRCFDIGEVFGWTVDLKNTIDSSLTSGTGDLASTVAQYKSAVTKSIEDTMKLFD